MIKKSQKLKVVERPEKQSKFYSFKEALNLISTKIYSSEWLFENHLENHINVDAARYVKTLRTLEMLIKHRFFEVQKIDGQKVDQDQDITFIVDGKKVTEEYQIPQSQLDYVLKTGKRFCDQKQTKFVKPVIYMALFRSNFEEVQLKFNKQEIGKIKEQIRINDFGNWIKKNDLTKDQVHLVMLGINPEYFASLSYEEKRAIDNSNLFLDNDKGGLQLIYIDDFIENFKHLLWENDWGKFIKNLYLKSPILNPTFASRCNRFIAYLQDINAFPTCFDHYLDHSLFRPNYDEYFKKEKELDNETAAFLMMGLEPEYAKRYIEYADIIDADSQKRYSALGDDEKVFFYKSYWGFLDANFIFIGKKNSIIERGNYEGSLEKYIDDLHNKGFLLNEFLLDYLKRKKKEPKLNIDSEIYRLFSFLSQMRYWKLEDVYNLILDKSPIDGEQIIFPLGKQYSGFNFYRSHDKKTYSVLLKSHKFCDLQTIDQFYPKEGEGYRPQDVLEWLITHTFIDIPDLLVELTFKNSKNPSDAKKLAGLRKIMKSTKIEVIKSGRPSVIDYPRVWEIFITEVLEGEFDRNNSQYEQQAKLAFDKMKDEKRIKLRKSGRSNFVQHILSKCENKTEIGRTSVADKIVLPFETEFDDGFFQ